MPKHVYLLETLIEIHKMYTETVDLLVKLGLLFRVLPVPFFINLNFYCSPTPKQMETVLYCC